MRIGVITFPGSLDDRDAARAVRLAGAEPVGLWHGDRGLRGVDAVILPGGFSYGDYLRCGVTARFAPVMSEFVPAARAGLPILHICNGFQILCGRTCCRRADSQRQPEVHHQGVPLRVENASTAWTRPTPAASGRRAAEEREGAYAADPGCASQPQASGQISSGPAGENPSGSAAAIAGVCNAEGNMVGLMPRPEHAVDPLAGPFADGLSFFASVLARVAREPVTDTVARRRPRAPQPSQLGLTLGRVQKIVATLGRRPPAPSWPCTR